MHGWFDPDYYNSGLVTTLNWVNICWNLDVYAHRFIWSDYCAFKKKETTPCNASVLFIIVYMYTDTVILTLM